MADTMSDEKLLPNPEHQPWCIANSATKLRGDPHGCNCPLNKPDYPDSSAPGEAGHLASGGYADGQQPHSEGKPTAETLPSLGEGDLRAALRKLAVVGHVRAASGGAWVECGYSCKLCKAETELTDESAFVHKDDCLLSKSPRAPEGDKAAVPEEAIEAICTEIFPSLWPKDFDQTAQEIWRSRAHNIYRVICPSQAAEARVSAPEGWNAPDVLPPVPERSEREYIIAVRRAHSGKAYTFASVYLNGFRLNYEDCPLATPCASMDDCFECDGCPTTGWFETYGDDGDAKQYQRLALQPGDEFLGWRNLPTWEAQGASVSPRVAEDWRLFETAPEDGTEIMVYRPDAGVFMAHFVESDAFTSTLENPPEGDCLWFSTCGDDLTNDLPTHWMPKPVGPTLSAAPSSPVSRLIARETEAWAKRFDEMAAEEMRQGKTVGNDGLPATLLENDDNARSYRLAARVLRARIPAAERERQEAERAVIEQAAVVRRAHHHGPSAEVFETQMSILGNFLDALTRLCKSEAQSSGTGNGDGSKDGGGNV